MIQEILINLIKKRNVWNIEIQIENPIDILIALWQGKVNL